MNGMRLFISAAVLILAINVFVLAGVAWNRYTKDAEMSLTERELPLGWQEKENSGISLNISWHMEDSNWFDQRKLMEVGFDCSKPLEDPKAEIFYRKALHRKTFAVLEFEGKSWDRWLGDKREKVDKLEKKGDKKDLEFAQLDLARAATSASRLFAVDAGNDADKLRQKYPDRQHYIILPAEVRLHFYGALENKGRAKEPPRISGSIVAILTDSVVVPRDKTRLLEKLDRSKNVSYYYSSSRDQPVPPRYRVTLACGKRHEPWVEKIEPL